MKKIIAASLVAGLFASTGVFASGAAVTPTPKQLVAGYLEFRAGSATNINLAQQFAVTAIAGRSGFVKNNFESTLSANVAAGVSDLAATNRFGAVAGSNKGYAVFTGSSVGGSVSQCGPQILKTVTNLAASEVDGDTLNLANANGCGIATP
ncbi:hypothetical protein [uncultured Pseudomonas sp.]|uniref:hypothetical protein n=1 Tax=uncultured Pseudomonas sp. TaxID=114707 RepID=UPI0030D75968|tara:strand:+ start:7303 stop:7755 length:453 start_codon:yes stop_codon:yes gene_type:complete